MRFAVEVRAVEEGESVDCSTSSIYVVDGDELFERSYAPVVGLIVRSLAARAELAQVDHDWMWGDHDE